MAVYPEMFCKKRKRALKFFVFGALFLCRVVSLLESSPRLSPEVACHFVPADDGGSEEVGGVAVEHLLCFFGVGGVQFLPCFLDEGQFAHAFVDEIVACGFHRLAVGAPAHGGEAVGFAVAPQCGVVAVGVLSAYFEHLRQFGGSAEDGEAWTLSGVVECHPCDAAHLVGQPRAQLDDGAVGAPGHADGADVFHRGVAHGVVHVDFVGAHPWIGEGRHDAVGFALHDFAVFVFAFGIGNHVASAEVLRGAFIVGAQELHDALHAHFLVGLDAERQVFHLVGELQ